jgi:hypothetical protein
MARGLMVGAVLALAAGGCLPSDQDSLLVPSNQFDDGVKAVRTSPTIQVVSHAPATEEVAQRVLRVAAEVSAANPQLTLQPKYTTIGAPTEELFHKGDGVVFVTEGLVRKCKTDAQLAAVLCHELGVMAAERAATVNWAVRRPDRGPPTDVPVGNDAGGAFGPADGVHAMELAKYETSRRAAMPPAPDAEGLARGYFEKYGGKPADWDAVAPLLKAADEHMTLEKTFAGMAPSASLR